MIDDEDGEVAGPRNLEVVLEVGIVIGVDQLPDQDHVHILDQEVVHGHMIDTEDIDVAGNAKNGVKCCVNY